MPTNYEERLPIPIQGPRIITLFTKSGLQIATGYQRVVLGGRGPYVELIRENMQIPYCERWRLTSGVAMYTEYRTKDNANVKIYYQKKIVDYADYKIGWYYISPFDLYTENQKPLIEPLRKRN